MRSSLDVHRVFSWFFLQTGVESNTSPGGGLKWTPIWRSSTLAIPVALWLDWKGTGSSAQTIPLAPKVRKSTEARLPSVKRMYVCFAHEIDEVTSGKITKPTRLSLKILEIPHARPEPSKRHPSSHQIRFKPVFQKKPGPLTGRPHRDRAS